MKASTGLRNALLATGSLKSQLDGGKILIYSGPVPVTADAAIDAASNPLLATISNNSTATGLTLAADAANGSLSKNASEVWSGVNAASGVATFYRHVAAGDDGTLSTTQARLQGTVDLSGADMNLSATNLVTGATQTIDYYTVALPTL